MQIKFASVMVDDQAKALRFYTDVLGFTKIADISMGEYRWLTVTSPEGMAEGRIVPGADRVPACPDLIRRFRPVQAFRPECSPCRASTRSTRTSEVLGAVFRGEVEWAGPSPNVVFEVTGGNLVNLKYIYIA